MGCGCSADVAGDFHGAASEDLAKLPPPTLEELRVHREIDNVDFYSDALSADEPSALSASVAMRARLLVFRLSHGIDDNPNQFQDEINANEPVVVLDDYVFVKEWMAETFTALDGEMPVPVPDPFASSGLSAAGMTGNDERRPKESSSTKTQPAAIVQAAPTPTACGAKPNHIRRRDSISSPWSAAGDALATVAAAPGPAADDAGHRRSCNPHRPVAGPAEAPSEDSQQQQQHKQNHPPRIHQQQQQPQLHSSSAQVNQGDTDGDQPTGHNSSSDPPLPVPRSPVHAQRVTQPSAAARALGGGENIDTRAHVEEHEPSPSCGEDDHPVVAADACPANKYRQPISPATERAEVTQSPPEMQLEGAVTDSMMLVSGEAKRLNNNDDGDDVRGAAAATTGSGFRARASLSDSKGREGAICFPGAVEQES